jgi:hypothetical protein
MLCEEELAKCYASIADKRKTAMVLSLLLRPAAITCVCFLALVLLTDLVLMVYTSAKQDVLLSLSSWQGYLWSGALWMISFTVAIRLEYWIVRLRMH